MWHKYMILGKLDPSLKEWADPARHWMAAFSCLDVERKKAGMID